LAINSHYRTDQEYCEHRSQLHDYDEEAGVVSDIRDRIVDAELM